MVDYSKYGLGRVPSVDSRNRFYQMGSVIPVKKELYDKPQRYWNANGWWGDQGNTSSCTGFAWAHWIEDGPVTHKGVAPIVDPFKIYHGGQVNDEWEGTAYEGTSILGTAKWLQHNNIIGNYYWGYDIDTVLYVLFNVGPVVLGVNWHLDMFEPDPISNTIKATGPVIGGHAVVLNGGSLTREQGRIKNSWGRAWGDDGHAWISFSDLDKLIRNQGEACLALENKIIQPG
jgi:hypothetical protein